MSTVKVDTIKPVTSGGDLSLQGDSGGSAVDCLNITSAGDINFTGNTDAKIKLPSAGGIYESDGTTPILTESGGAVSLANVDIKALINASGSAPIFACRAWICFDGTSTVSILGSGNVASLVDNSVGNYTINLTTALEDNDFAVSGTVIGSTVGYGSKVLGGSGQANTTTSTRINLQNDAGANADSNNVSIMVIR